jgi:hypothetical protein
MDMSLQNKASRECHHPTPPTHIQTFIACPLSLKKLPITVLLLCTTTTSVEVLNIFADISPHPTISSLSSEQQ